MGEPRSPSLLFSLSLNFFVTPFVILLLNFRNVACGIDQFDPLIELPGSTSEHLRNSSRNRTTVLYVDDFGVQGDGIVDDTEAFLQMWKVACSRSSATTVVIPAGKKLLLRPINFSGPCRSKVTLRISGNIIAPEDPDIWDGLDPNKWLYFHDINDLTIEGGGTVDGNGHKWWAQSCKIDRKNPCRSAPKALTFHRCNKMRVRNIKVTDAQQMHMAFTYCQQISVSNLCVEAPATSPNTDGIHISASTNVQIKSCVIGTGDDCISIVSNSSKITIEDITCGPGHGISIGSLGKAKAYDVVHDVNVNGVAMSNTQNGVRIKSWQGGRGYASNISFENVMMENVSNPIIIDQYYCDSFDPCPNQTSAVKVSRISYVGIKGTSATEEAIKFACSDSSPCEKLYLEDIELVPYSGEDTNAFCWEAYGSTSGEVYPPSCFQCDDYKIIQQKAQSRSTPPI